MGLQLNNCPTVDPTTGETIDPLNADQLVDGLERIKERLKRLWAVRAQFEDAIALLAKCEAKTERVAGDRRKVKVEWPGKQFDKPGLKLLWNQWPKLREQFLRIESVGVQLVEYDKLIRTSGPQDMENFKQALVGLERESMDRPTISIEK